MSLFVPLEPAELEWQDGVPYSTHYGDRYCCAENGLEESKHVFIEGNLLTSRWATLNPGSSQPFVIGEMGFGTGLNFILAWSHWNRIAPNKAKLHYFACEKHPLSKHQLQQCLALWPTLDPYIQVLVDAYPDVLTPGHHVILLEEGRVQLTLLFGDAVSMFNGLLLCADNALEPTLRTAFVDAWFLDGFSPACNPDLWQDTLFSVMSLLSNANTTLSTFSVAGAVRAGLSAAGFIVTKQPGYGRKREMLFGQWQRPPTHRVRKTTPWHIASMSLRPKKRAIVLGAGLAGCYISHGLAQRGWDVTLLDERAVVGQGASGNRRAILFPNLSAYRAPLTELMLSSFLHAHRFYKRVLSTASVGELSGLIQLVGDREGTPLAAWLSHYPGLGQCLSAEQASALAGVRLDSKAIHISMAGWMDSPALCAFLINHPNIRIINNVTVDELEHNRHQWILADQQAEVVILANGHRVNQFQQTQSLPVQPIRGQMTEAQANVSSERLRMPLCSDGHILPAQYGLHFIGATFDLDVSTTEWHSDDNELNVTKINRLSPELALSPLNCSQWVGVRGAVLDHIPLVGPVADVERFTNVFSRLAGHVNQWVPAPGFYYPGLYVFAGFGSRGLTTIPLCGDYLLSLIEGEMGILPRSLVQALSPARFIIRDMIQFKKA